MNLRPSAPRVSVVVATFNRHASLDRLLRQLCVQTLAADQFEVVVVDDGSQPPVSGLREGLQRPYRLKLVQQANAGAAAARHRGLLESQGDIIVITDDDMQVPAEFLAAHLARHTPGSRRVVFGRIRASPRLDDMPLFERFHAGLLDRWTARHDNALCTGNVSLHRSDYLAAGGFDTALERSEDMDLGLRLEQAGVELVFSEEAFTIHHSDHMDFSVWRRGAFLYGRCGVRIARKYPRLEYADPWRFFFGNALAKRPFIAATLAFPDLGRWLGGLVLRSALAADWLGLERLAVPAVSLLWDLEYFRGLREEVGGFAPTLRSCLEFLEKAERADESRARPGPARSLVGRALRAILSRMTPDERSEG